MADRKRSAAASLDEEEHAESGLQPPRSKRPCISPGDSGRNVDDSADSRDDSTTERRDGSAAMNPPSSSSLDGRLEPSVTNDHVIQQSSGASTAGQEGLRNIGGSEDTGDPQPVTPNLSAKVWDVLSHPAVQRNFGSSAEAVIWRLLRLHGVVDRKGIVQSQLLAYMEQSAKMARRAYSQHAARSIPDAWRFPLLSLPPEIINRIGLFCSDYRLALPTRALSKYLNPLFERPSDIAVRALRHYRTPEIALVEECSHGNVAVLEVLSRYANVNATVGMFKAQPLTKAAEHGRLDAVRFLLEKGADLRYSNNQALRQAVMHGHKDVVTLLLDNGADADTALDVTVSALVSGLYSMVDGPGPGAALDLVHYLIDRGAFVTPGALFSGAQRGSPELMNLLVDSVAGAELVVDDYDRALYQAAMGGNGRVVRFFAERGADVNFLNGGSLIMGAEAGNLEVVEALMDHGADVTVQGYKA
ncbi:ankyrin, partial [Gonapodya prolifera JEL478]